MPNLVNVPGIENVSEAFKEKVVKIAADLETDPNFLMAIMSFETGRTFSPKKKSPVSGATGLIQFMPATAADLGTSISKLVKMTAEEQLDVVAQYFKRFKGRMKTLEDAYMAVLFPKAIGKGSGFVLFKKPSIQFTQNKGLDLNGDGLITVGEAAQRVRAGLGVGGDTLAEVTVLHKGMKGPEVDSLQDEMIDLGYLTLEEKKSGPGKFGPKTEGAVKRFQSDNDLTANGTFDLPTQAAVRQLNEGVQFGSKGGVVLPMQKLLVGAKKLTQAQLNTGPGTFGENTRKALITFQLDNNLEPNGILTDETYRQLYKVALPKKTVPTGNNTEVNTVLPERGEGFRTFLREPEGATQFGTQLAINALIDLARSWFLIHPEVPIQYGHISRKGGGPFFSTVNPGKLAHQSHKDGRTVDIRPIRKDNVMAATDFNNSTYDPVRTKELVMLIREKHPKVDIIFNDPKFVKAKLSRPFKGHDNHLHVRLP
ncbi:MAG TPA: peptidoglycan-binding protein [Pyrinomonadaceae bacterium]|nr:peptidoglycan-binding protein [Pyrinomonadaceae bacterium]